MTDLHEAMLYEKRDEKKVQCSVCAHRCLLKDGQFGVCGVRLNNDGTLYSLVYGELIASNIDPIEKKPLYHVLPASRSYSIATIGCNFKCGFCQNWQISQQTKKESRRPTRFVSPENIVRDAVENCCESIAYTYTEPTIYLELAYDTARLAKEKGLLNVFVTNGYMTAETIETLSSCLHAANIDLKSFRDLFYKKHCKGTLQPVLDSIQKMKELGIWVEVTTLVIPGENDSEDELKDIARFLANTGIDIPWHISRFHPTYEFPNHSPTGMQIVQKAKDIGLAAGLKYVYLGNVSTKTETFCPACHTLLISRNYYLTKSLMKEPGVCHKCGEKIDGIWNRW